MLYILAVDYDGTLFEGTWPKLGSPREDVIEQTKAFIKHGAEVVLWTCRESKSLQEAVSRCTEQGLEFNAINENTTASKEYQQTKLIEKGEVFGLRKIYADIYVDDKSPGSIEYFLALNAKEECKRKQRRGDD